MSWTDTAFEEPERIQFAKLENIGDSIEGIFAGTEQRRNTFGKEEVHIRVKTGETHEGEAIIESLRANQRLLAQVAPLKRGQKVRIEYVDDRENDGVDKQGQPLKPSKLYRVQVDDGRAGSSPPPPTSPRPVAEDDIPF